MIQAAIMNAPTASAFRATGSKGRGINPTASGTSTEKIKPAKGRHRRETAGSAFGFAFDLTSIAVSVMFIRDPLSQEKRCSRNQD